MAEIAAGALAAEQVLSTAAQATAAYTVAQPTNGLKAAFSQIATSVADGTRASLVRSNHSLTVVGNRAYIFGGRTSSNNKLADNEIHSLALPTQDEADKADYRLIPALPVSEGGGVPSARSDHSACAANGRVAIFAGRDETGALIQDATIWLFDAKLFVQGNDFVVYGGTDEGGLPLEDVWRFDLRVQDLVPPTRRARGHLQRRLRGPHPLPHRRQRRPQQQSPLPRHQPSSRRPAGNVGEHRFPTNPLAPGPRPRENGGLLHVSTGYGRNYLLYFFGERSTSGPPASSGDEEETNSKPTQWSDMWTLQLPSSDVAHKSTTISEAVKPAKIKDAIRAAFGASASTREVQVQPPGDVAGHSGKLHPGPRGFFGYDVTEKKDSIVVWGGMDAKGEMEGDGWIIQLQ
ncbi:hypothetical protein PG994_005563 [Apiospora phragmitis]|uniref:Galactose oxidase n=1 Tax=Apiospora phragmitis TaxID=2905665 RepID=A0ABR1VDL9_9PEZI